MPAKIKKAMPQKSIVLGIDNSSSPVCQFLENKNGKIKRKKTMNY
jgi:hypothetical protein